MIEQTEKPFDLKLKEFIEELNKNIDPKDNTHLFDLMCIFLQERQLCGITVTHLGYTVDGIMADIRYSVDHKNYIITITEKR